MDLEQIYTRIWDCLCAAVRLDNHPFKVMQAATVGLDGAPNVRTVLLRGANEANNLLTFHTDVRSPKVAELSREPRVALVSVDPVQNLQIRVAGATRIVRDDPARVEAWQSSPDHDLVAYRTHLAPGTPLNRAGDALDATDDIPDASAGLRHFCVVEVRPTRLDWLDLSLADLPLRARYVRDGDRWTQHWIAP